MTTTQHTDVHKASGRSIPDLLLEAKLEIPEGVDRTKLFERDAGRLVSALKATLPGGTLRRVIVQLLLDYCGKARSDPAIVNALTTAVVIIACGVTDVTPRGAGVYILHCARCPVISSITVEHFTETYAKMNELGWALIPTQHGADISGVCPKCQEATKNELAT
jgi:hypothetical protein